MTEALPEEIIVKVWAIEAKDIRITLIEKYTSFFVCILFAFFSKYINEINLRNVTPMTKGVFADESAMIIRNIVSVSESSCGCSLLKAFRPIKKIANEKKNGLDVSQSTKS